jgi:hypothetical protein
MQCSCNKWQQMALPMEPLVSTLVPTESAAFAIDAGEALAPSLKERLVGLLPLLCLVHCVGTAILASVMPAAALWMENDLLEAGLSALSALLISVLVLRQRGLGWLTLLLGAVLAVGATGWLVHSSWLRHGALLGLCAVQLLWLYERRLRARRLATAKTADPAACACSGHGHHHPRRHAHRH